MDVNFMCNGEKRSERGKVWNCDLNDFLMGYDGWLRRGKAVWWRKYF
jgi:hypothetical protein